MKRIAIVGGGLSGLYAAYLLEQKGITDYELIEARPTLGGRIASVSPSGDPAADVVETTEDIDRFDLGPSWFWPGIQPQLDRFVSDMGLERFAQHEDGETMVERSPNEPPIRMRGYVNSPTSMRLVGGMGGMIDALRHNLPPSRIVTGLTVRQLQVKDLHIELDCVTFHGHSTTKIAEHVLLAMPPRLVVTSINFAPELPKDLVLQWRSTSTWMASQAKYFAFYDTPFWRQQGLSGDAHSAHGPLSEIHDATMPGGSAALFGFFGIPARMRKNMPGKVLREHCRAQLVRLFGEKAANPRGEAIKDWALEPFTATASDLTGAGQHAEAPLSAIRLGPWSGRVVGIGSEWSRAFPGYLAGAIDAATRGVEEIVGIDGAHVAQSVHSRS